MKANALTDKQIQAAKPGDLNPKTGKPITQLTDGMGLYLKLFFDRDRGHSWRFDYTRPTNKLRNTLVFGTYPAMSLKEARQRATKAREQVACGIDPAEQRDSAKEAAEAAQRAIALADERKLRNLAPAGTFQGVCEDYHAQQVQNGNWTELHAAQWLAMFTRKVFADKALALKPFGQVTAVELKDLLAQIEAAGQVPTARALRKYLGNVYDYAIALGLATTCLPRVIAKQLKQRHKGGNNPAVTTPEALAPVLRLIRDYGNPIFRAALMLQVVCFQRPSDTAAARWADIDLEAGLWFIRAESEDDAGETKIGRSLNGHDHVSPLPRQMVAELRALREVTGNSEWVFPSMSAERRGLPINNDGLSQALRDMGLKGQQTPHGFRATARTMIEEQLDIRAKYIEAQLAHAAGIEGLDGGMRRDLLGAAYNRATHLEKRVHMVQAWADYLDSLLAAEAVTAEPLKLAA